MAERDLVADALRAAVADHGRMVLRDPARLRAVLADLLGADLTAHRVEVDAVIALVAAGAGTALADGTSLLDLRMVHLLATSGLPAGPARQAAAVIAAALPSRGEFGPTEIDDHGPAGRGNGTPADGTDVPALPPDRPARRRWAVLGAASAVAVAAAAAYGITAFVARSGHATEEIAGPPAVTVTATPPSSVTTVRGASTTVVSTAMSTRLSTVRSTKKAAGPTTTTMTVLADRDQEVYDAVCAAWYDDLSGEIRRSQNAWASGDDTARTAVAVSKQFAGQIAGIDGLLGRAPATATSVINVLGRVRGSMVALRGALADGGTDAYRTDTWNTAMIEYSRNEDGMNDACWAAGGSVTFGAEAAAVASTCKAVRPAAIAANAAIETWRADPTTAAAAKVTSTLKAWDEARVEARNDHLVLYLHPVRLAMHDLGWWGYNLGQRAAAGDEPPEEWLTGWSVSFDLLEQQC